MIRLRTIGKGDNCRPGPVTVMIDRGRGLVMVRPLRRRRLYTLPLGAVADMVVARVVRVETLAVNAERANRRKVKRGRRVGAL
jgi:hypothetical protein